MFKINSHEFLIRILFKEYHSWQGKIISLETKKEVHFKSALEMIFQIQEMLESEVTINEPHEEKIEPVTGDEKKKSQKSGESA